MKLKLVSISLALILFSNCKNEKIKNAETIRISSESKVFKDFIKKFKILKVPLTIEPLKIQAEKFLPLTKTEFKFLDLQVNNTNLDNVYMYGILQDTIDSYKIIYLIPAEIYTPFLVTYTKSGKKISEETLSVGGCGSDCGFICNEYVKIYSDLKIYSVDSIKSYECDSIGIKENTLKKYIRYKKGNIKKNGQIIMSKILEKNQ